MILLKTHKPPKWHGGKLRVYTEQHARLALVNNPRTLVRSTSIVKTLRKNDAVLQNN